MWSKISCLNAKKPALIHTSDSLMGRTPVTRPPGFVDTTWYELVSTHREEARHPVHGPEVLDVRVEVEIGEAVAVVGEERLVVVEVRLHRAEALADARRQAGVDERDAPVVDVAVQQAQLGAAAR